jgi:tRNA threonylcarbamoyladenosine biosynthesis protein TsaE
MIHKTHSLKEFNAEAKRFARTLEPGSKARIVALSGDLGAGKTTYVQTLAREFGVEDQVNSPTFVIEKVYECSEGPFVRLVHIDAYRLKNARELKVLGWQEIAADAGNLILIEWPENVADLIPEDAMRISLSGEDNERTIQYYDDGEK